MTSPHASGAPQRSAPRRKANLSPLRRISRTVLIAGTVVSVLATFGPTWAVRGGIALAIVAAVAACLVAWREISVVSRNHARAMLSASRAHGEALREERSRNAAVVDTLSQRTRDAAGQIVTQRRVISELKVQIGSLQGERAQLSREIRLREHVIADLRQTVSIQEAELTTLLRDDADQVDGAVAGRSAEVHLLPRRMLTEQPPATDQAGETELWADGSVPSVVDLVAAESRVTLPNYEGDRLRA